MDGGLDFNYALVMSQPALAWWRPSCRKSAWMLSSAAVLCLTLIAVSLFGSLTLSSAHRWSVGVWCGALMVDNDPGQRTPDPAPGTLELRWTAESAGPFVLYVLAKTALPQFKQHEAGFRLDEGWVVIVPLWIPTILLLCASFLAWSRRTRTQDVNHPDA